METKEFTNDFSQGMTNIPSDSVCQDDSVAAEWNMIFRNGEHQPIQAPVNPFEGQVEESRKTFQLLYVHNYNNIKRLIFYDEKSSYLYWSYFNDVNTQTLLFDSFKIQKSEINGITSIGNTLIISFSTDEYKSLYYFLWKPELSDNTGSYKLIGTKLPQPQLDFTLKYNGIVENGASADGIMSGSSSGPEINKDRQDDFDALVIGLYSKNKKKADSLKRFINPFKIRYAVKLFDGSETLISTPVILFPSITDNTYCDYNSNGSVNYANIISSICSLWYRNNKDLSEWNDIIKSISIFITKPIDVYNTSNNQSLIFEKDTTFVSSNRIIYKNDKNEYEERKIEYFRQDSDFYWINCKVLNKKEESDIIRELSDESVFYKIANINNLIKKSEYESIDSFIKSVDMEELTTAEQLEHDDYYSNCSITSENIYMYNKRLHLSNVSRGFYEGSVSFLPLTMENPFGNIISYVYINTGEGQKIVKHDYNTNDCIHKYYFYPDPRAKKVEFFYENGTHILTLELKPHPLLNGAYFISDTLPNASTSSETWVRENKEQPTESIKPESLQNEVWVSEVNNPFVFNASGINTVGNGSIIGIVSNTTALSQGQFGQFPLICFTTDGIYALETSSTGIYSSANPISREICNNKNSIVATDQIVFFSSEKGLMMINGSQVTCVSSMLSGKTFYPTPQENEVMVKYNLGLVPSLIDFLKEAMIAYDYRDNLLWILNPNHKLVYILSIDSGAFGMTTIPDYPVNVINDYPDTIIETKNGETFKTLSLINRPNINDDERRIDGFIFSRPMKFGNPVGLKNLSELRLIERLNGKAGYRLRVFVSDDLKNWTRTNSLRGRGFKYYKLNLIFENMLPTDTVSAIIGRVQTRYQTKFR